MDDVRAIETERKSGSSWILYVLLGIVVLAGGFFFWKYNVSNHERAILEEKNHADSLRITDLDSKYTAALDTLSSYKGLNAELDSLIAIKENELADCRNDFLSMVRKNKVNEEAYKKQIAHLDSLNINFQSQITQLQADNKLATIQRDSLGRLVLAQGDTIDYLADSNNLLTKRVLMGSLLKPTTITGAGVRTKGNGKEVVSSKASKAKQLRVCFTVPANDIATADQKTFYVRIIGPENNVMTGSTARLLTKAETGEQIPYSTTTTLSYKNAEAHLCAYFQQQEAAFQKGRYAIEIYQDGYLTGEQRFTLK